MCLVLHESRAGRTALSARDTTAWDRVVRPYRLGARSWPKNQWLQAPSADGEGINDKVNSGDYSCVIIDQRGTCRIIYGA